MQGWLRIKSAAKYVDISERTLRGWLGQGLRHSRVGACVLIKAEHLDEWLEAHAVDTGQVERLVDEVLADF